MIRFKTGDMLAEDAKALVNTVNCVGFWGAASPILRKDMPRWPGTAATTVG